MRVIVYKSKRLLNVVDKDGVIVMSCRVSLGFNPVGHKEREGDGKTPEGVYQLIRNPGVTYPQAFFITYPTPGQVAQAHQKDINPGWDILVHGFSKKLNNHHKDHWKEDWTRGCIAVTDEEMEQLRALVPFGTTIEILP